MIDDYNKERRFYIIKKNSYYVIFLIFMKRVFFIKKIVLEEYNVQRRQLDKLLYKGNDNVNNWRILNI